MQSEREASVDSPPETSAITSLKGMTMAIYRQLWHWRCASENKGIVSSGKWTGFDTPMPFVFASQMMIADMFGLSPTCRQVAHHLEILEKTHFKNTPLIRTGTVRHDPVLAKELRAYVEAGKIKFPKSEGRPDDKRRNVYLVLIEPRIWVAGLTTGPRRRHKPAKPDGEPKKKPLPAIRPDQPGLFDEGVNGSSGLLPITGVDTSSGLLPSTENGSSGLLVVSERAPFISIKNTPHKTLVGRVGVANSENDKSPHEKAERLLEVWFAVWERAREAKSDLFAASELIDEYGFDRAVGGMRRLPAVLSAKHTGWPACSSLAGAKRFMVDAVRIFDRGVTDAKFKDDAERKRDHEKQWEADDLRVQHEWEERWDDLEDLDERDDIERSVAGRAKLGTYNNRPAIFRHMCADELRKRRSE